MRVHHLKWLEDPHPATKRKTLVNFRRLSAIVSGLVFAATALAQSTETFGDLAFSLPTLTGASENTNVSIPTFDTGLGTLTGVALTLNATIDGYAVVINLGTGTDTFTNASANFAQSGGYITLTGPAGLTATANSIVPAFSGSVGPGYGVLAFSSAVPTIIPATSESDPNLSLYETAGAGSITSQLSLSAYGSSTVTGTNVGVGVSASASGDLSVKYTYTQIPEPSAYAAILGVAVLGYAILRRKGLSALNF
jgi:PEP-CTERM motif-containing protein